MAKGKILLVEDIYFNQMLIESLLTEWDYEVITVDNGSDALEKLEAEEFNLIILDLMLPVMDGFKFLEKKNNIGNNTPVVVLSARTDLESVKKAMNLGAKDYITKPFNSNDLENKVKVFISK